MTAIASFAAWSLEKLTPEEVRVWPLLDVYWIGRLSTFVVSAAVRARGAPAAA